MTDLLSRITWLSEDSFVIDAVTFSFLEPPWDSQRSTEDHFVLLKTKFHLDSYAQYVQASAVNSILELGIYQGGSTVLFDKLYAPAKLLAIDISQEPTVPLESYVADDAKSHRIRTVYNMNQGSPELRKIAETEFPDGIDLVVDDASHLYQQTKLSFNMLFPLVNPGKYYIIEDWAWAHSAGDYQEPDGQWAAEPALTNLVFELLMLLGTERAGVQSIAANPAMIVIQRSIDAPEAGFDVSERYVSRGKKLPLI